MGKISQVAILIGAVFLAPIAGHADASSMDGHWCFTNGERIQIDGAKIVTSAGNQVTGKYDQNSFSYIAPKAEPSAGGRVEFQLMAEDEIHMRIDGGKHRILRRCLGPD